MMEFSRSAKYTAKKPHKCFLCDEQIREGEKYERYTGKYDGDFFDQCFHEECNALLYKFAIDQQENEYSPDWVEDWLCERVCRDCSQNENCDKNVFRCRNVLDIMLED